MSQNDNPLFEFSGVPLPEPEPKPSAEKKAKQIESDLPENLGKA